MLRTNKFIINQICAAILILIVVRICSAQIPENDSLLSAGAREAVKSGDYDAAIAEYKTFLKRKPNDPDVQYNLAMAYHQSNLKYQTVKKTALRRAETELGIARIYGAALPEAAARAAELSAKVAVLSGEIKYSYAGYNNTALLELNAITNNAGTIFLLWDNAAAIEAKARAGKAEIYLSAQDSENALKEANVVLKLVPKSTAARLLLGIIYGAKCLREQSNCAEAEANFAQAVELDPKNYRAYFGRGAIRAQRGRSAEAITDLSKAAALKNDSQILLLRAASLAAANETTRAIADFEKVSAENSELSDLASFELGNLYLGQKNHREALKYFRLAEKQKFADQQLLANKLRQAGGEVASIAAAPIAAAQISAAIEKYAVGQEIEARFDGIHGDLWYPGKVLAIIGDGYKIFYPSSGASEVVPLSRLRPVPRPKLGATAFSVNQKVEVQLEGAWTNAEIIEIEGATRYRVRLGGGGGRREFSVAGAQIRLFDFE